MKPGFKTTEFWVTLATNLIGLLVLFGVVGPEQQEELVQAAGGLVSAISSAAYAISRGNAKVNNGGG